MPASQQKRMALEAPNHHLDGGVAYIVTEFPNHIREALTAAGMPDAAAHVAEWVESQQLGVVEVPTAKVPTYQIVIPWGGRSHPLLTIQPPGHSPDVPLQKMRNLRGSPYSNPGARLLVVQELNRRVPESERKPDSYRERFYKLEWKLLDDRAQFDRIREVLDGIIVRVRAA